ncbi:hypothetical protein CR164_11825 [Prosthecochloris marina]|uniref:Uncharacterized protein n=1 Tax=Prosthecochloris marina TaxID=2017681 RepID=A0A317T2U6_9CHLB|nr:hypothetical protein CR164_11825 [Prosthecochloris marina]
MFDPRRARETNLHIQPQLSKTFLRFFTRFRSSRFSRFPFSHAWYRTSGSLEPARFLQRALNVEKEPFTSKQKTEKRKKRGMGSEVNNLLIY